jgi:lysophospholipase L1-like esterase
MRWVAIALLVCGGTAVWAQKKAVDAKGAVEDFGGLARYRDANAELAPEAAGRVVFFGDSITDAWPIGTTYFVGKPYVNRGISGQTTPQMLLRFRQDVIDLHPATVVILAGTNDIAGNTGPETDEQIEGNLASMNDLAQAHGIAVVMASILPVAKYPWKPELTPAARIRGINAWMGDYCDVNDCTYLDYYNALVDPATGGMKDGTSRDGVHPNAAGYAIMEPLAAAALAQ